MNSVDWARVVNDCSVKGKKGDPQLTEGLNWKKNHHPVKKFVKTFIQTAMTYFGFIKPSSTFVF